MIIGAKSGSIKKRNWRFVSAVMARDGEQVWRGYRLTWLKGYGNGRSMNGGALMALLVFGLSFPDMDLDDDVVTTILTSPSSWQTSKAGNASFSTSCVCGSDPGGNRQYDWTI
jgi:hypothetical protein